MQKYARNFISSSGSVKSVTGAGKVGRQQQQKKIRARVRDAARQTRDTFETKEEQENSSLRKMSKDYY